MKAVVFGGSGLIGRNLIQVFQGQEVDTVIASRENGVNALTGERLDEVIQGADVVIDVMDAQTVDDHLSREFFTKTTTNLLAASKKASVKNYVVLSIVGTENLQKAGYFQGKLKQETLIAESGIPYTIVRATQFFEFALFIAHLATEGDKIRLPSAKLQPIAAIDVAKNIALAATEAPQNGIIEIAGPEKIGLNDFVGRALAAVKDTRRVVTDESALYVGLFPINDSTITPKGNARLGTITLNSWLADPNSKFK